VSQQRIRIGIVGAGIAAVSAHLPALAQSEDFEIVALCERNSERLAAVARQWGIPHTAESIEEFLRVPDLHAVIIATPPESHAPLALACIEAGLHLLVEKPLAADVPQCEAILDAARRQGVAVAVNHEKRFHPTLQRIAALLREGAIGDPWYCGVHWASTVKLAPDSFIPPEFDEGYRWRWQSRAIGGGIVQDHLPHYVDLLSQWTRAVPVGAYAHLWNLGRDRLGWETAKSVWEDMGLVLIRFSTGLVLRLETGVVGRSLSPLWSQGSGIGEWTEYGYLLGTEGQIVFDLLPWDSSENGRIALWQLERAKREKTGWALVEQAEPSRRHGSPSGAAHAMFGGQIRDFARLLRGEPAVIATGQDGRMTIAAVEAAYQSAVSRRECPISGELAQLPGRSTILEPIVEM
jgi:predicted dehydrogenase